MKILFITHNASMYGANRSLLSLVIELKKFGVIPLIYCPKEGDFTKKLSDEGVEYHIKKFDNWVYYKRYEILKFPIILFKNIVFLLKNHFTFKNNLPDVVYSNSSVVTLGAILNILYNIPHIWHIREFGDRDYGIKYFFGSKGRNFLYNKANGVISISNAIYEHVLKKVKTPKLIIYNGVVHKAYLENKEVKSIDKDATINFAIVGALAPYKNHRDAIIAFKSYQKINLNSKLLIFGDTSDGKYYDELKSLVKNNKLDQNVIFKGFNPNMEEIYKEVDVLLMCSKNEGMGRVTIEAMANGIPVIGYNGGATPELISEGYNGLLYHQNHADLCDRMHQLVNSKDLYETISSNAIAEVKSKFTIEAYADNVYNVINHKTSAKV